MKKPSMQPGCLQAGVHRLEDGIITLSGPALAISGIIAGVDLLTGGHLLQSVGWLSVTWAVCLLLTLDFQVLTLGVKAQAVYQSQEKSGWKKFGELILLLAVAAAISYVSIQMQSIIARSSSANVSVDQAALQLGVDPIALIWERSILVLLLIFLSGWSRDRGSVTPTMTGSVGGQLPDLVDAIIAKLTPALTPLHQSFFDQLTGASQAALTQACEQLTRSSQEVLAQMLHRVSDENRVNSHRLADQVSQDNQATLVASIAQIRRENEAILAECIRHLEQAHARRFEAVLTRVQQVQVTLEDVAQNTAQIPAIKPVHQPRLTQGRGQHTEVASEKMTPAAVDATGSVTPPSDGQNAEMNDPGQGSIAAGSAEGQSSGKGVAVQMFIASYLAAQGSLPGVKTVMAQVPCARNTARFYLRQAGASEQQESDE